MPRRLALLAFTLLLLLACKKFGRGEDRDMEATDHRSRMRVPGSWSEQKDLNEKADLQVGSRSAQEYLIVLTEPKADFASMDAARYLEHHLSKLETGLTSPQRVPTATRNVGTYGAAQSELSGTMENTNLVYLITAVEGPKHFHAIIAWTTKGRYADAKPTFEKAIQSFQEI